MQDVIISERIIDRAEKAGACRKAIEWLRKKPRTVNQLSRKDRMWPLWAIEHLVPRRLRLKTYVEWRDLEKEDWSWDRYYWERNRLFRNHLKAYLLTLKGTRTTRSR